MKEWVKAVADSKGISFFEVEPQEARITLLCEPIDPNHQRCEMEAIVPRDLQEEVVNVWKEIRNEEDELEIISKLIALILEVDDNPHVKVEFDNYFLRIEINPPN